MAQVRDNMTTDVVTVEPSTTIADAAQGMIAKEEGPLPVVEAGRVVAVVTTATSSPESSRQTAIPTRLGSRTARRRTS